MKPESEIPEGMPATLLDALSRRDASAVLELASARVELTVCGVPGIGPTENDRLWRDVRRTGVDAVRGYLTELYATLPSLTMLVRGGADDNSDLVADATGVDGQGIPFSARLHIEMELSKTRVSRFHAVIGEVARGPELLRGDDPRVYFKYFLSAA
ncbi:MAG: hypothetical protein ACYDGR_02865 [Candidatus Dormibacteria bacterium]